MRTRAGTHRAHLLLAVSVLTAAVSISACSGPAAEPSGTSTPAKTSVSAASAPEAASTGRREAPERGTCWTVAPSNFREDYWFDDSPKVPCNQPHTSETVLVYDLETPTPAKALEIGSLCQTQARVYLGSDRTRWVPWFAALFLPSKKQVARGESWARCDVAMSPATTSRADAVSRTGSIKDAINKSPADVWACTNRELVSGEDTSARFVDCRKPHLFEATGNVMVYDGLDSYPDKAALGAEEGPCRRSLNDEQRSDGLAVKTVWASPAQLRERDDGALIGWCWRFRKDGSPLPSMT